MNNIVQFVPKNNPEDPEDDTVEKFLVSIAADTDQLIFIRINKEGHLSLGHSPLATKDLIVMYYQINRYINHLLENGEGLYGEDDDS